MDALDSVTAGQTGVAIVVWRRPPLEVLLLHRRHKGESFEGDWAWTTPGGRRNPEERAAATAARELLEETGLTLECVPVASDIAHSQPELELAVFTAEAQPSSSVSLSWEHDRYEWVQAGQLSRCRPAWVGELYCQAPESLDPA